MNYSFGKIKFNVLVEKKNNKNTYIKIKSSSEILITTNYFITKKQIIKLIENNKNFIISGLEKVNKKEEKDRNFYFLGKKYNIIIIPDSNVEIISDNIYVSSYQKLDKWLNNQIKQIYMDRLRYLYNLFSEDIPYPKLRIRKMKTRWGVCNRKLEVVTLNSELIKYDISKLDYVIIHELSHFVYFNHSKEFWKTVEKYCPIYKKIRKELKD